MAPHDVFQYYPKDFNFCFDVDESDKSAPGWTCDRFSTRGTAPLGLFYYLLEEDPGVQGLFGAMNRVDADFATKPSQGDRQRVGSITFGCYKPRTQIQKTSGHPAQPEQADLLYCGLGGNQPFCLPYTEYSSYDAQTGVAGWNSIPTTQLPFVGHGSYQGTWNRLTMFFHAGFATINPPGSLNSEPAVRMNCQQVGLP